MSKKSKILSELCGGTDDSCCKSLQSLSVRLDGRTAYRCFKIVRGGGGKPSSTMMPRYSSALSYERRSRHTPRSASCVSGASSTSKRCGLASSEHADMTASAPVCARHSTASA